MQIGDMAKNGIIYCRAFEMNGSQYEDMGRVGFRCPVKKSHNKKEWIDTAASSLIRWVNLMFAVKTWQLQKGTHIQTMVDGK